MLRRIIKAVALAASVALICATAHAWLAGHAGYAYWGAAVGDAWLHVEPRNGRLRACLFTPDDPLAVRTLEEVRNMPQQTHSSYDTRPDIPDFLIVSSGALAIESEYSRYLSIDEGCWAWFLIDRERDLPYLAPGVEPEICGNDPGCFIAGSVSEVIAPLWIGLVLGGITPSVIAVAGWRRRLRRRKGFCATCGYNLTGLPEPRCPECGTAFSAGP